MAESLQAGSSAIKSWTRSPNAGSVNAQPVEGLEIDVKPNFPAKAINPLRLRPANPCSRPRSTAALRSAAVGGSSNADNGRNSRSSKPDSRPMIAKSHRFWLMGRCPNTSPLARLQRRGRRQTAVPIETSATARVIMNRRLGRESIRP